MEKKIVFASHNENKVREVREMLSPLGITVLSLSDLGLKQTAEETADTFEGNSLIKAKDIAVRCEIAVLSDEGLFDLSVGRDVGHGRDECRLSIGNA